MEVIVEHHVSNTHCSGYDKLGRRYFIKMKEGFRYLKGKKLIGTKKFIGDIRCLVDVVEVDDKFVIPLVPKQPEYIYA